jgi:hypothetical protein
VKSRGGGTNARVFAGQRAESSAVNLDTLFELGNAPL